MMQGTNPYQQYKEQALSTLAPGELLVKLYDEMIKQMLIAQRALDKKDYGTVNTALNKTQTVLGTLNSSLNMQYDVSANLRDLYIFIAKELQQANLKKETQPIEHCIPLVRDLRDSFEQAEKITRMQQSTGYRGQAG